ncbi:MAG: alpha/beta hydrolase [Anaerolineaceae bacterium]
MTIIAVDRARLFYETIGSGKPVLLIHGLGLDHSIWKPMVKLFSQERQFILPDIRGQGRSTLGAGYGELDQIAEDLVRLLDELRIEKAVLAGHSMGGYIALAFAEKHMDRLAGLALVTSNARADSPDKRQARLKDARRSLDEGVSFVAANMAPKLTRSKTIVKHLQKMIERTGPAGMSNVLMAIANRENQLQMLANLAVPTMAIFGVDDQIALQGVDTEIEQANPQVKVIRLPGVGHMPMLEAPLALGALLLTV